MTVNAILFDLDGTLVDSMTDIADSANRVLTRFGFPTHRATAYRWFIGDGLDVLVERILPEAARNPETIQNVLAAMRTEYGAHWHDNTRPYDGILELLVHCRDRGLMMAVLTNKPHEPAVAMIHHFNLTPFFRVVQGVQPGHPKKPDPAMALAIANQCEVSPADCLFLGDMAVDMKTATGAGMTAVGAMWGLRSAQDLVDAGAQALFRSPADLMAWL